MANIYNGAFSSKSSNSAEEGIPFLAFQEGDPQYVGSEGSSPCTSQR